MKNIRKHAEEVVRNFRVDRYGIQFPESYAAVRILQGDEILDVESELDSYREQVYELLMGDEDFANERGMVEIFFDAAVFRPNLGGYRSATFAAWSIPISAKRGVIVSCECVEGKTSKLQSFNRSSAGYAFVGKIKNFTSCVVLGDIVIDGKVVA